MILRFTIILCLIFCVPAIAQVTVDTDLVRPQPVCVTNQPEPVLIEAQKYEHTGSTLRAFGSVFFQKGKARLNASVAEYDYNARSGRMQDVIFTTCERRKPDYRLEAREVTLLPNNKLRARDASLFLGNLRVLTLPSIKLSTGGQSAANNVFPIPGFDPDDGFTLSQNLRLIDNDRFRTVADLRLTTENGVQGQFTGIYGLNGNLDYFPGRFLTYDSLRADVLELPKEPVGGPCSPESMEPVNAARLRAFGTFSLKQRTYDIENDNLIVYKQPELGLRYIGKQINFTGTKLDPRLDIYPEIITTWGRYRESPGLPGYTDRGLINATAGLNFWSLGPSTTVQPVISHTWATYSNGDSYQQAAYAVDASHLWSNSSYASVRYITRSESGVTPFQFDNIDIFHEFQGAFQVNFSSHTVGLVLSYDIDAEQLYDWEAMYGWHSDCLASWIRWRDRIQRLSFDVTLINL
ncbi:MAG: hypothetical protein ABFD49_00490 [Armatimonadota bacterium]|nr:hypothetical protein [bacterium]